MAQQVITSSGVIRGAALVYYGTSLPSSPTDGQETILVDSATSPTYQWRFRYNTSSSNSDKWEFIGGSPAVSYVATQETRGVADGTYAALTTAGPSFSLPRAGVYDIGIGFAGPNGTHSGYMSMSYDIGGTGAVRADEATVGSANASGTGAETTCWRLQRKTGLGAVTLTAKYSIENGGTTGSFQRRTMVVTPVRIS